ncbi:hypothetical protein [Chryseobacterium shigense]|uniref:Uncharacterized protein n=1 Tax=Chryseobacterium shigense TaxID=297244 RepID=A0A841NE84_9FLAO|nr:hypothetical protein [Chryseobacterium shigense]MBB6369659.1 hypothetical protein [Chryseobacterium shigense]
MKTKYISELKSDFRFFGALFLFCFHSIQAQLYISRGTIIYRAENIFSDSIKIENENPEAKIYVSSNTIIVNPHNISNHRIVEVKSKKNIVKSSGKLIEKSHTKTFEKSKHVAVKTENKNIEKLSFSSSPVPQHFFSSSQKNTVAVIPVTNTHPSGFIPALKDFFKHRSSQEKKSRIVFYYDFLLSQINFSAFSVRPPPVFIIGFYLV